MKWRSQPFVEENMYSSIVEVAAAQQMAWLQSQLNDESVMMWIIKFRKRECGVVKIEQVDWINRSCFWSFYIGERDCLNRGAGVSVEYVILHIVFHLMQLNSLFCEVLPHNESVIKLHKHFGFELHSERYVKYWKSGGLTKANVLIARKSSIALEKIKSMDVKRFIGN